MIINFLWKIFHKPIVLVVLGGSVISAGTIHDLRRVKVPGTGPLWNPWVVHVPVSVSSSDQGFSSSRRREKWYFRLIFFQILPIWEAFCRHSTVFVIIETRVWKTQRVSDDYMTGLLFRLITFAGWNKISMQIPVNGTQCTIVWAICDGNAPYWRTHLFLMGHIKFWCDGTAQSDLCSLKFD